MPANFTLTGVLLAAVPMHPCADMFKPPNASHPVPFVYADKGNISFSTAIARAPGRLDGDAEGMYVTVRSSRRSGLDVMTSLMSARQHKTAGCSLSSTFR